MCFCDVFLLTLPEANFRYTKNFRLRRQHQQLNQQQHQQPKQQPKQQQHQQLKQQPKQQQILIEFGPPAQIYTIGLSIFELFGKKSCYYSLCVFLRCLLFGDFARSQF